jgi:mannosyltransferase OCH1-like enzyme
MKKVVFSLLISLLLVFGVYKIITKHRAYSYADFCALLEQENINCVKSYVEMNKSFISKYSKINKDAKQDLIPLIHHQVYTFGKYEPRIIRDILTVRMIRSMTRLKEENSNWKHYLWTNDIGAIPEVLRAVKNLEIRDVKDFQGHILYEHALEKINSKHLPDFVQASDIFRLIAVEKYGGVYQDCDGEIFRAKDLHILMRNFDLILGEEANNFTKHTKLYSKDISINSIPNAFFAASANHPLLVHEINLIKRNLDKTEKIPAYIKNPKNDFYKVLFETGPVALTVSYFQYIDTLNERGWQDRSIVLPSMVLYNDKLAQSLEPHNPQCRVNQMEVQNFGTYNGIKINTIAADLHCSKWANAARKKSQWWYILLHPEMRW